VTHPFIAAVQAAAPNCRLACDATGMEPFLTDCRGIFRGDALCVASPSTTADVAAVVGAARAHGVAVVPQGGNTGLAGGATPMGRQPQVVLHLGRMRAIRRIDRVGMTLEAEAGCILQSAKEAAQEKGRLLPISFAAEGSATVGGMIATNAGGINALRYGTVRQQVLGLEAVMSDGSVLRAMSGLRKDNSGYDWKHWLIGSEGTLGIVTAAVLRLSPLPTQRHVAFVAVDSPAAALRLLERLQDSVGNALSAFELMSGTSVARVLQHQGGRLPLEQAGAWYVLLELSDQAAAQLGPQLEAELFAAMDAGDARDAAVADNLDQMRQFWALRENITEAERHVGRSFKHDVAVAVSAMPDFIERASAAVTALHADLSLNVFGHLGDGNVHFNVLAPDGLESLGERVHHVVHDVVAACEGSIAAEHGIGQYRVTELQRLKPPQEMAWMARVKRALDPENLLNPGKLLPAEQNHVA
jgi:FAD/FMN-containing dehydrogenase